MVKLLNKICNMNERYMMCYGFCFSKEYCFRLLFEYHDKILYISFFLLPLPVTLLIHTLFSYSLPEVNFD